MYHITVIHLNLIQLVLAYINSDDINIVTILDIFFIYVSE